MMQPYTESAAIYDVVYTKKDYAGEVEILRRLIAEHGGPSSGTLLDVACGTGAHLVHLKEHYTCAGLDQSPGLLQVARHKLPNVPFYEGDMRSFDLGRRFDIVTCLFSAIGYVQTRDGLAAAVAVMARHVAPGGLLIIEPWFTPERFIPGHIHADLTETETLKICRMSIASREGLRSIIDFHHMIATMEGVSTFHERHEMGLFNIEDHLDAFAAAGLETAYDKTGVEGRGLYIGRQHAT